MKIHSRSEWGAAPPRSRTPAVPGQWKGVVVHWFGSPRAVRRPDQVPGQLRGVQRSHQAGEFVDVAYNFAVDQWGRVWELRGLRTQTGANGTTQSNRAYCAVVVMIGTGDRATPKALAALRQTILWLREQGVGREVRPHGSITGSECPGPQITEWIRNRAYEPSAPKPRKPAVEPLDEVILLLEESAARKRGHRRIVEALRRLRAIRRGR